MFLLLWTSFEALIGRFCFDIGSNTEEPKESGHMDRYSHQTFGTGKTLGMLKPLLAVLPEDDGEEKNMLEDGNAKHQK